MHDVHRAHEERVRGADRVAEAREGDAPVALALEEAEEDVVGALGDGEHVAQEVGVAPVRDVARVRVVRCVPGVVAGDHGEEDHAQRPDVVRARVVCWTLDVVFANAFCGDTESVMSGRDLREGGVRTYLDSCTGSYQRRTLLTGGFWSRDRSRSGGALYPPPSR